ncbi:hypothetical protein [Metapseudomonas otitidis]|uniref:hypothetical protein n=1 Tax=Metapseudomonas otitidis TaxID=319939 RepID=UPI0013F5F102|nr:hypothetical protein [Pseudomonas otitidis]
MANANSIEHCESAAYCRVAGGGSFASTHEKKSCSMAALSELELLDLRGKRILVSEQFKHTLPDARFVARVMAVNLPLPNSGLETSLLLSQEGYGEDFDTMDYAPVSRLTLIDRL